MAKAIGTLGTIETITVGGRVFTDLSNLITLIGYNNSNSYCTMRKNTGSAGYQVTTGKTLTLHAARLHLVTATASSFAAKIYQADNDAGVDVTTVPTNPVYPGGNSSMAFVPVVGTTAGTYETVLSGFGIAAQKYVYHERGGASNIQITYAFGYET